MKLYSLRGYKAFRVDGDCPAWLTFKSVQRLINKAGIDNNCVILSLDHHLIITAIDHFAVFIQVNHLNKTHSRGGGRGHLRLIIQSLINKGDPVLIRALHGNADILRVFPRHTVPLDLLRRDGVGPVIDSQRSFIGDGVSKRIDIIYLYFHRRGKDTSVLKSNLTAAWAGGSHRQRHRVGVCQFPSLEGLSFNQMIARRIASLYRISHLLPVFTHIVDAYQSVRNGFRFRFRFNIRYLVKEIHFVRACAIFVHIHILPVFITGCRHVAALHVMGLGIDGKSARLGEMPGGGAGDRLPGVNIQIIDLHPRIDYGFRLGFRLGLGFRFGLHNRRRIHLIQLRFLRLQGNIQPESLHNLIISAIRVHLQRVAQSRHDTAVSIAA